MHNHGPAHHRLVAKIDHPSGLHRTWLLAVRSWFALQSCCDLNSGVVVMLFFSAAMHVLQPPTCCLTLYITTFGDIIPTAHTILPLLLACLPRLCHPPSTLHTNSDPLKFLLIDWPYHSRVICSC
jgi:hypothetical protein